MQARRCIALALLLISYDDAARSEAPSHAGAASVACDAATASVLAIIAENRGQLLAFATEDYRIQGLPRSNGWLRSWGKMSIPKTPSIVLLVRQLGKQGGRNAVGRCTSLRKMFAVQGVGYGPAAVNAAARIMASHRGKASIYSLSLPVVSPDGKQAMIAVDYSGGGLVGASYVQLLERQPRGGWKRVGEVPLAVG